MPGIDEILVIVIFAAGTRIAVELGARIFAQMTETTPVPDKGKFMTVQADDPGCSMPSAVPPETIADQLARSIDCAIHTIIDCIDTGPAILKIASY